MRVHCIVSTFSYLNSDMSECTEESRSSRSSSDVILAAVLRYSCLQYGLCISLCPIFILNTKLKLGLVKLGQRNLSKNCSTMEMYIKNSSKVRLSNISTPSIYESEVQAYWEDVKVWSRSRWPHTCNPQGSLKTTEKYDVLSGSDIDNLDPILLGQ